ncbi:hypothetical protein PR202_gb25141 [Eleusine coracana subsp. coracana]|uniref:Uncharacterized protein n=1 Tax=Eleusine coracana subsp. coracana TaxID=191504 RepID=A0AAV5FKK4_ELECO|nr:hypothetical protein PR202_gb25141 [Eleusine coracana subsp. coracana]
MIMNNDNKMMMKAAASPSSSSSSSVISGVSSGGSSSPVTDELALQEAELEEAAMATTAASQHQHQEHSYTMDQLWNEIAAAEEAGYVADHWGFGQHHGGAAVELPSMPSPVWELCPDYYSLWRIDDEEYYKNILHASS